MEIVWEPKKLDKVHVGDLLYKTLVTGVPGHPDSIYMKIPKRSDWHGTGICVQYPSNHSILLNLRSGLLRAVGHETEVTVLEGSLYLKTADDILPFVKSCAEEYYA